MPQYHRVLVRYRLDHSDQWSPLYWCDIDRADSEVQVKVAKADPNAAMPPEDIFILLSPESAKKLLVLDYSGLDLESTQSMWPLRVGSHNECHATYCLVTKDNEMFRVDFQPISHLFNQQGGQRWISETAFDRQNLLRLQNFFTDEEIAADPRLRMRSNDPADNYDLLTTYSAEEIERYQQQYRAWQTLRSRVIALENVVSRTPEVGARHSETNPDQNWRSQRRNPVDIAMEAVPSGLENSDRNIVHNYACRELTQIKTATSTQEEYQRVLYTLVTNSPIPVEFSEDLISTIGLFRNIMLRDSDDLNDLFSQEGSSRPSLYLVYQYVLELVFLELQTQDFSLVDVRSDQYVAACPDSYLRLYLGRSNPRQEVLCAFVVSEEDDARLARRLDEEQRRAAVPPLIARYDGRNNLFRPSNRSSGYAAPDLSSGIYSLLYRVMGTGLCAWGVCVAWSSFFTGVAIIVGGLCCLLAAVAFSNHNMRARDYMPPAGAFGGYPLGM